MKNSFVITLILVLVVGGGAFYGGMKYQQSMRGRAGTGQFGNRPGTPGQTNGGAARTTRGGQVMGEILKADSTSITVKLADGSSKIVLISDKTTINKAAEGSLSDLTVGARVAVFGTENADKSYSAQSVQINPIFRGLTPSGTPQ